MPTESSVPARPSSLILACVGALLLGLLMVGLAVASIAAGHGTFSGAIGGWLALYGLVGVASAWGLWHGSIFGRGPVVTTSALNLIVAASMAGAAPQAWVVVVLAAITLVAVALPATSRALRWTRVTPADEPPQPGAQGS